MKHENTNPIIRPEFKEAFYRIGDKLITLDTVLDCMDDEDAKSELNDILRTLYVAHDQLKNWANTHLQNWD